jgi:HSP20 family protein
MPLSLYRPLRLSEMMDRMFDDNFFGPRAVDGYSMPLDVYVTENDYLVRAVVPGLKPEDLKVEINDNTVTIKGEVFPPEKANEKVNILLQEIRYGKFVRSLSISGELDGDKAEAHVENGLLTLRIPKSEAAKPKLIKVKAK